MSDCPQAADTWSSMKNKKIPVPKQRQDAIELSHKKLQTQLKRGKQKTGKFKSIENTFKLKSW